MIESRHAFETYKELVDMAPDMISIVISILGEVLNVSTINMEEYVKSHQSLYSRLMKTDPQGTTEASTHHAHMKRLFESLSAEQQIKMHLLMSTWEYRSKA